MIFNFRTMTLASFIIFATQHSKMAQAEESGMGTRGGGNAVVCFADAKTADEIRKGNGDLEDRYIKQIVSVETFDLYEARKARGLSGTLPDLYEVDGKETTTEYHDRLISHFDPTLPFLREIYEQGRKSLNPQFVVWQPSGVRKVDDFNPPGRIPDSCVIATAAYQSEEGGQTHLNIDTRLYELLTRTGQDALWLHEYFYSYARHRGHTNSDSVRTLVGMLLRKDLDVTVGQFIGTLAGLQLGAAPYSDNLPDSSFLLSAPARLIAEAGRAMQTRAKEVRNSYNKSDPALIMDIRDFFEKIQKTSSAKVSTCDQLDVCDQPLEFIATKDAIENGRTILNSTQFRSLTRGERKVYDGLLERYRVGFDRFAADVKSETRQEYDSRWDDRIASIVGMPIVSKDKIRQIFSEQVPEVLKTVVRFDGVNRLDSFEVTREVSNPLEPTGTYFWIPADQDLEFAFTSDAQNSRIVGRPGIQPVEDRAIKILFNLDLNYRAAE